MTDPVDLAAATVRLGRAAMLYGQARSRISDDDLRDPAVARHLAVRLATLCTAAVAYCQSLGHLDPPAIP
jgi:hypothetical protein